MSVGWSIFVSVALGIIVGLASWRVGASLTEGIILVFLTEVALGIFNIDRLLRPKPAERMQHIAPEANILKRAREMRARAKHSLYCNWCAMEYDGNLKKYFDEFRGLESTVYRLINVKRRPIDIAVHLERFIGEIRTGKYVVTSTRHQAFEFLVADKNEVLILVPYATQYGLSEGFYSADVDLAHAIFRMYEDLLNEGNSLVIPAEVSDNEAKEIITEWIEEVMQ